MRAHKIAVLGVLTGVALILGYVERLIPVFSAMPGIKLGLSNTVLLYALYIMNWKEAMTLMVLKVVLSGLLFAGLSGALYGFSGGLLSLMFMILIQRSDGFSIVGVSMVGAVFHNIGQIGMAMLVVQTKGLLLYLPVLIISGAITGMLTGMIAQNVLKGLKTCHP
ncbi:Gx transporter family protein [Tindallia californiensis]|uniref:Heptaprenyl diphosphate synthase n=1 Tax=Tindallia californiensis TaxID=159292 RepID=A0A1H3P4F7_9FIRM|nr:Gx transporter family protein [Tindallia californiensis]SDY95996.1 heptaprenyl diphosphate synthase [Tindallia californiensis]